MDILFSSWTCPLDPARRSRSELPNVGQHGWYRSCDSQPLRGAIRGSANGSLLVPSPAAQRSHLRRGQTIEPETTPLDVDLTALLQALGRRGSSATLLLADPGWRGELHLCDGQIVHATSGSLRGSEALLDLLNRTTGSLRLMPLDLAPIPAIDPGLADLVLVGCPGGTSASAPTPSSVVAAPRDE